MLFCCFSHVEFWHLFINMVVLWKVVPAVEHIMTAEQFVATYISSGECVPCQFSLSVHRQ